MANSLLPETGIIRQSLDSHHSIQGKHYDIKRRAPPPPKFSSKSAPALECISDVSSNYVYVRYTNIDCARNTNSREFLGENLHKWCLVSIINKLIEKEQLYVLTLKSLSYQLEIVSTNVCNKMSLLGDILDFHSEILVKNFFRTLNPLEIPNLFRKFQNKLELYVAFTNARRDFSYLVMDLCDAIIDHFKARLLEYNFTVSQIKNLCLNDAETKMNCIKAESVIKNVYQKINLTLKDNTEIQE